MKFKRKWVFCLAGLTAISCSFSYGNIAKADTNMISNEQVSNDQDKKLTLPFYEVGPNESLDEGHYMGFDGELDMTVNQPSYPRIQDGQYGTDKDANYDWVTPHGENDFYVIIDGNAFYSRTLSPMNKFYVHLTQFKPFIHFVDVATNQEIAKTNDRYIVDVGNDTYKFDQVPEETMLKGYALTYKQGNYKVGDHLDDVIAYVEKVAPEDNFANFVIHKHIKGSLGKELVVTENFKVPSDSDETITDSLLDISRNSNFNPILSTSKGGYTTEWDMERQSSVDVKQSLLSYDNWNYQALSGATLIADLFYDDYNDDVTPISFDMTVPSNLEANLIPKVHAEGKLGETVKVNVPDVKGYKADKNTISAIVNADGTITTDEKVNYSKESDSGSDSNSNGGSNSSSNSGSHSHSNITISNVNLHIATIKGNKKFLADEKKNQNGQISYRVGVGQWLNANDIYIYEEFNGYVRTYSDSVKRLISVDGKNINNRALSSSSDWFSDRMAMFDGDMYYRVATNEWVKKSDVFEYRINRSIINILAGTVLYNERGQKVRMFADDMSLKTDRIAQINGKEYYRVASNEYVLVTDIK